MGDLFKNTHIITFSKDNLKELNKEINEKIYSLLSKVTRTNLSAPCLLQFVANYNTMEIGITITHRKQDNRVKDIPHCFLNSYNKKIPEEDEKYFYFGDAKKGYSNLMISPDFIFSTLEIDFAKSISKIVSSKGFFLFPRTIYNIMKNHNKMLFDYLDLSIENDILIVKYKSVENDILFEITDEMERIMQITAFPLEYSKYPEEMKDIFRKFSLEKNSLYNINKDMIGLKGIVIDQNDDDFIIFNDFLLGIPKSIDFVNFDTDETESEKVCNAMICVKYNGWYAYYYYKYMKFKGIDYNKRTYDE